MQKDCHYYGTYYISRVAGFSHEDALEIAWAAETVDECDIAMLSKLEIKSNDENCILTVLDKDENILGGLVLNEERDSPDDTLTAIRAIWMPFHFLPGNFYPASSGKIPYNGAKYSKWIGRQSEDDDIKWTSQDDHDMALMCRTSSKTCMEMINNARRQYQKYKDDVIDKVYGLYAVGIAMHVLADTWSHEYFCGSPSFYVNYVETGALNWHFGSGILKVFSQLPPIHSVTCLGHGPADSDPDIAYKAFTVYPVWKTELQDNSVTRRNVSRFSSAFIQMLFSLKYIKGDTDTINLKPLVYNTAFKSKYKSISELIEKIRKNVFTKKVTLQDKKWISYIKDDKEYTSGVDMDQYPYDIGTKDKVNKFLMMAKLHRDCVINYLNKCEAARPGCFQNTSNLVYRPNAKEITSVHQYDPHVFSKKDVDKAVRKFYDKHRIRHYNYKLRKNGI